MTSIPESQLLRALMEYSADRIYYKDRDGRFIHGSRAFAQLFSLENFSQIEGKTDFDFFSDEHAQAAFRDEQEIIRTGEPKLNMEELETWPDGRTSWCSTSKAALRDDQGNIIGTFGISRDITNRKLAQEALKESEASHRKLSAELAVVNRDLAQANMLLEKLSFTDSLTNLWNRHFLMSRLPEDIALVDRAYRALGASPERLNHNVDILFLMVDLDHFKEVNDEYGHLAGDLVLQQVGEILKRASRTSDTVARVGGEEFLVVARQTARADSHIVAERIRAAVAAHPFHVGQQNTIHCTCSVGFTVYPFLLDQSERFSWEQVVEIADNCLYGAKNNGRNAWVGLVPTREQTTQPGTLPKEMPALVRSGIFPVVSSLSKPVKW